MSRVNVSLYLDRLKLNAETLDELPTAAKLCALQEAHLREVPFENTAQHGVHGGPPTLNLAGTADKILVQKRGGFCYEVNMLFAELLRALGYGVTLMPAVVYSRYIGRYRDYATHVALVVRADENGALWLADVGLGEPSLHPLRCDRAHLGAAQRTPEGMRSKVTLAADGDGDSAELWWWKGGAWQPRLKWSYAESLRGAPPAAFRPGFNAVLDEESLFAKGLIVCALTRHVKISLAGNRLKITGGRFEDEKVEERYLRSVDEARQVLQVKFGIPLENTRGLTIDLTGNDNMWSFK